jgi:hypothetical protein
MEITTVYYKPFVIMTIDLTIKLNFKSDNNLNAPDILRIKSDNMHGDNN